MIAPAAALPPSATRSGRQRSCRQWRSPSPAVAGRWTAVAAQARVAPTPRCVSRGPPASRRRSPRATHPAATPAAAASHPPAAATRSAGYGRARAAGASTGRQQPADTVRQGATGVCAPAQDLRATTPSDQPAAPGRGGVALPEKPPAPTAARPTPGMRRHRDAAWGVPPPPEAQAACRARRPAPATASPHRARARGLRLPGTPGRGRASRLGLCGSSHPKVIPDQNAIVAGMRPRR